jgi:hypothetical protein
MDSELHARVQARAGEHAHEGRKYDHALTGLLFCGACCGWSPMSIAWSRKSRRDGTRLERPRFRCVHRVYDRDFCPETNGIDGRRVELILLASLRAQLDGGRLAHGRFARARQAYVEQTSALSAMYEERIADAEAAQEMLFARRQNGEVIPDRIYNREMLHYEQLIAGARDEREGHVRRSTVSSGAAQALRDELREQGDLLPERWFSFAPGRRNDFLRLMHPYGVLIYPRRRSSPFGDMTGRVGPRRHEDVQEADARHDGLTTRQRRAARRARRVVAEDRHASADGVA